jgi:hypothetical protein
VPALRYWDVESAVVRLSELKIGAIINTSSGGCDSESEEEMLKIAQGCGHWRTHDLVWHGRSNGAVICRSDRAELEGEDLVAPFQRRRNDSFSLTRRAPEMTRSSPLGSAGC